FIANDIMWNPTYSSSVVPYYNSLANLFSYLIVVFLVSNIKMLHERLEEKVNERTNSLIEEINERKLTEKALQESEERFRNAFENAAIGFAICMPDGDILRVNQALCNILGYSEEELTTRTFQDITHQDDLGFNMDQINQLLSGKFPAVHFQKRYIHKLGHEIWASLSVSLVRDDKG